MKSGLKLIQKKINCTVTSYNCISILFTNVQKILYEIFWGVQVENANYECNQYFSIK